MLKFISSCFYSLLTG